MPPQSVPRSPGTFAWYLKRLRVMRPAELVHRLGEQLTIARLRAEHGRYTPSTPATLSFCEEREAQLPELPWDETGIDAQAGTLLAGRWPALGYDWQWHPLPEIWRSAPDTGRLWPAAFFAAIEHRAGNPHGDVRVAWEPARLQQLVSLALLARRASEPTAEQATGLIEAQLLSFVAANPPWTGIHYLSAMECALRLIAVCHAVDLVRQRLHGRTAVWAAVSALVASHAPLIARRLSLHSSAGNHTVAECVGLIYAGVLFPELTGAAAWCERGLALLSTEMQRQVLADGGGVEQALWYLLLITDLAGLGIALLDHRRQAVPVPLRDCVVRARRFLGAFAREPAGLPPIGDRDDGYALSSALCLSFVPSAPDAAVQTFTDAGCTRVRAAGGGGYEVLFDHGPLGMPPAFGHGHADALSLCLRVAGRDLLIDPGTFTYTGDLAWRRYFRSTGAHNTVTVDGLDQAVQETAFMWRQPFNSTLVRSESAPGVYRALARHDGYARLPGKVVHWRGFVLKSTGFLLVWDHLDGVGAHHLELRWHTGGVAAHTGGTWLLGEDTVLDIDGGEQTVVQGQTDPLAGWRSPVYGIRQPAPLVRAISNRALPCEFVTRVYPRGTAGATVQMNEELEILRAWARAR